MDPRPSGIGCGLVTAGAIGAVLGSLGEYQVRDYADMDTTLGFAGTVIAAVAAAAVIAVLGRIAGRWGARWPVAHVAVPMVLVPLAVAPLVTVAERNRLEAALIWGAAAVAVHVLLAYALAGGRWRRWAAAGLVLPCVAAALVTVGCQTRWRAQKFEAVGLPLYVPEVPGYRLTGSWAGRYSVSMTLAGPAGRRLHAVIEGPGPGVGGCGPDGRPRLSTEVYHGTVSAVFCLRDGAVLQLVPGGAGPAGVGDLLPVVTMREVDGSVLADRPDDSSMSEPD
jgi:hypothetical protein